MAGEIPTRLPDDVVASEGYQTWKNEALRALEPTRRVSDRQRFADHDTNYDNPDKSPGVVRFRTEDGESFEQDLIGEAQTVQRSREFLLLGGQIASLKTQKDEVKEELVTKAEQGWRGTEFDDLDGVGRVVSAIPEQSAKVVDREMLMLTTGENFPKVAETVLKLSINVPEGHRVRGRIMQPEDIIEIINSVVAKSRLKANWTRETVITDLDVLRELIERDLVSPESIEVNRDFTLRPDVLPKDRTPRPQKTQE